jgi:hypothetical protein
VRGWPDENEAIYSVPFIPELLRDNLSGSGALTGDLPVRQRTAGGAPAALRRASGRYNQSLNVTSFS